MFYVANPAIPQEFAQDFRLATLEDLDAIERIYEAIHDQEEAGQAVIGWVRGVYPTRSTAAEAIAAGEMFVQCQDGEVVASARINQDEVPEYALAAWKHKAAPEEIMVLHTLTVDPAAARGGIGKRFVAFYEAFAKHNGCPELRIDTNERNARARALYAKLGYDEVSIVPCEFNGIEGVQLVCMEKRV